MLTNRLTHLLLVGMVSLSAVPANAEIVEDAQPQARVTYDDLNLATSEGSEALQRRVHSAAEAVCARPVSNWQDRLSQRNCESKALEAVKPQLQQALLNAKQAFAMKGSEGTIVVR